MSVQRITPITLSDGRDLLYYDESDVPDRTTRDKRELEPIEVRSELRHDPIVDQWVIIASHRQARTHLPSSDACPLCPTSPDNLTEVPADDYDVVVFENRFPSLTLATPGEVAALDVPSAADSLFALRPGVGRCEVVSFSADHDASFASLTPSRVRTIVDAWADRTRALSLLPGVEQVFPFENRGREIGVTLSHPHGQIYAYPFVTPRTDRMLTAARAHAARTGRNLFADVLRAEQAAGVRIVGQDEYWTAFVPAAARWPVEVHLYPNRRVADLTELTDAERDSFAVLYLDVLRRVDGLYGLAMPYVAGWYQAPVRTGRDDAYLHLQLFSTRRAPDKLKYLAGSESAMDVFVNDVVPEEMAARLRDVVVP